MAEYYAAEISRACTTVFQAIRSHSSLSVHPPLTETGVFAEHPDHFFTAPSRDLSHLFQLSPEPPTAITLQDFINGETQEDANATEGIGENQSQSASVHLSGAPLPPLTTRTGAPNQPIFRPRTLTLQGHPRVCYVMVGPAHGHMRDRDLSGSVGHQSAARLAPLATTSFPAVLPPSSGAPLSFRSNCTSPVPGLFSSNSVGNATFSTGSLHNHMSSLASTSFPVDSSRAWPECRTLRSRSSPRVTPSDPLTPHQGLLFSHNTALYSAIAAVNHLARPLSVNTVRSSRADAYFICCNRHGRCTCG